jgi:hypothetical protein
LTLQRDELLSNLAFNFNLRRYTEVLKKGADFISIANFSADATSNPDCVFKNFLLKSNDKDLKELVDMVKAGTLKVPVDSVVDFKARPDAAPPFSTNHVSPSRLVIDSQPVTSAQPASSLTVSQSRQPVPPRH